MLDVNHLDGEITPNLLGRFIYAGTRNIMSVWKSFHKLSFLFSDLFCVDKQSQNISPVK